MGEFVWMSGIAGVQPDAVESSVRAAIRKQGGELEDAPDNYDGDDVVTLCWSAPDRVLVVYSMDVADPERLPVDLSRDLKAPVFGLHIHDGDLWLYTLYNGGKKKDQFNPRPDYWGEVSGRERRAWKGNADVVCQHWPGVRPEELDRFLVPWDEAGQAKAYEQDQHAYGDCWQIVDFMRRLGLPDPNGESNRKRLIRTGSPRPSMLRMLGIERKSPTPLHLAAGKGNRTRVLALLAQGADLEGEDECGQSPVCWAVQNNKIEMVKLLRSRGARLDHHNRFQGKGIPPDVQGTLLHVASAWGHVEIVAYLLDEGSDVNAVDVAGSTPLHVAVTRKRRAVVELLLQRGANPNLRDVSGRTPLAYAAIQYPELIPFLRERGARGTVHEAAGISDIALLEEWLRETPDGIHAPDPQGETPLHAAALCGGLVAVNYLLARGADPCARNRIGQSPLHHAASRGFFEIAKRLVEAGAELDVVDMAIGTPLHDAVAAGHLQIVKLLLDRGADVNCKGTSGLTPLDIETHVRRDPVVRGLLKEHGARPGEMFLRLVKEQKPRKPR